MQQDHEQRDGLIGRPKKLSKNEYVRTLPGMVQWGARPFGPLPDSRHSTRASEGALDFQTTSDSSTQHSDGTYPSSQEYPRAHRQFSSTSLPAIEHQMGSSRYDLPTFHDMPSEVYTHGSGSALGRGTDHARVHHIACQQTLLDRRTNNEYQQGDQQSIAGSHSQVAMQTMNAPSAQLVGRSAHIRSPPSRGTSAATSVSSRASHSSSARAQYASPYPPPSVQFSAPSYAEHRFASTQLGRSVSTSHSVFHAAASSSGFKDEHEAAHNLSKAAEHDDFLEEYF